LSDLSTGQFKGEAVDRHANILKIDSSKPKKEGGNVGQLPISYLVSSNKATAAQGASYTSAKPGLAVSGDIPEQVSPPEQDSIEDTREGENVEHHKTPESFSEQSEGASAGMVPANSGEIVTGNGRDGRRNQTNRGWEQGGVWTSVVDGSSSVPQASDTDSVDLGQGKQRTQYWRQADSLVEVCEGDDTGKHACIVGGG
jgi:hypothetical protein